MLVAGLAFTFGCASLLEGVAAAQDHGVASSDRLEASQTPAITPASVPARVATQVSAD